MFNSTKVVFLVDVASFFSREDRLSVTDYQQAVNAVKYCCLKFLTHFGTKKTRWGYKFYSSSGLARQRMEKRLFCDFNLESFEDFEDDLVRRFEHYRQACDAIDRSGSRSVPEKDPPCSVLRAALTQIFSEYQWDAPNLSSPVKWKSKRKRTCMNASYEDVNYIFNISPCPRTDDDVAAFLDGSHTADQDVADNILPAHVRRLWLASASAKFFWIDTTPLESDAVTRGAAASPKLRSAITALGGDVIPITTLVAAGSVFQSSDGRTEALGPLSAIPFSDVAESYLSGATTKSVQRTTLVVYSGTNIGSAVLCANSSRMLEEPIAAEDWKEIRIMCRTRQDARLCIFQTSRLQIFRCVSAGMRTYSKTPASALSELLSCLVNDNSAFFVELTLNHSCLRHYGFLFPLDLTSFCVHLITEPGPLTSNAFLQNFGNEFADVSRREVGFAPQSKTIGSVTEKPFGANVLEKWFVPASINTLIELSGMQEQSTSRECMLQMLRREYEMKAPISKDKGEHRVMSDQPTRPASVRNMRKCVSVSLPVLNSATIESAENTSLFTKRETVPITNPCCDIDQLVMHLKQCYDAALDSELPVSWLTCAQNIVSVVKRFAESQESQLSSGEIACKLLRDHFTLGCVQIAEKYACLKDDDNLKRRVREYQLQALLALEEEVNFQPAGNCVEKVTSLLRTLSFTYSPVSASEFLKGVVSCSYLANLKDIIVEIGEELNVSLSTEHNSALASEGDFFQLGSVQSVQSQESYLSSIPSSLNFQRGTDNPTNAVESKAMARVDLSQPSVPEKRQIVVKQTSSKRRAIDPEVPRKREKRSKTDNAQVNENALDGAKLQKSVLSTPKAKRRHVLKTTFVPETPHGKQGRKAVQRRQELLRKKFSVTVALPVVEETPEKKCLSRPTTSKSQTPVKYATRDMLSIAKVQRTQSSTTLKRGFCPKVLFSRFQSTPPGSNSSECLFSSPTSNTSPCALDQTPRSEKTPKKLNVCSGSELSESSEQQCFLTPRRKVSKKLLSSPSTPKLVLSHLNAVEASPAAKRVLSNSPVAALGRMTSLTKTERPRRLFNVKSCECSPGKVVALGSAATAQTGFDGQLCSATAGQSLCVSNDNVMITTSESSETSLGSPVLPECTSRFTRSKSRETGLTPHELFVLSQTSPVNNGSHASKKERGRKMVGCAMLKNTSQTPRQRVAKKVSYTPPSALSLLHLTSSPMLLKKSN
ncbi:treslin-like [Amblyomma americanum]